jgi:hypothetical protein
MGKRVLREELLDNEYRIYVFNKTFKAPMDEKRRWDLYHNIIEELMVLGDYNNVNEIKYRITDGEEPTIVLREKVSKLHTFSFNLQHLIKKL